MNDTPSDVYGSGWPESVELPFGGASCLVMLLTDDEEADEPTLSEDQREALSRFLRRWPALEGDVLDAMLAYYNGGERFSYGPDDPEEFDEWWPEITTRDDMARALTPETLCVPQSLQEDGHRRVYLLFGRAWGGEDTDDNGVAVGFSDEAIQEIGYKDIAF